MMGSGHRGAERRRHPRHAMEERAAILIGTSALVFSQTLNWSCGGACLKAPRRFAVKVGELLNLASARLGNDLTARVVGVTESGLHCAFERDLIAPRGA